MATKDDYYQKILASQQAEITSLKSSITNLTQEIDALKASIEGTTNTNEDVNKTGKDKDNGSDQEKRLFKYVNDFCESICQEHDASLSDRFAGKKDFEKFRKSINEKLISSETFTKYQEELDTRLKAVEERAGQGISLMAINRYYGEKPKGYKSIFDNYMVLNLKRTQFQGCLPVLVWFIIAALAALLWSLSK